MSSGPHTLTPPTSAELRLRLKPPALPTGVVDGAWWPRSADLPAQLTDLLTALWERLGGAERVGYDLGAWPDLPRRLVVNGRTVRLAGYRTRVAHTLDLVGGNGRTLTLLVIPEDADQQAAEATLEAAARPDATDTVAHLLALAAPTPDAALRTAP